MRTVAVTERIDAARIEAEETTVGSGARHGAPAVAVAADTEETTRIPAAASRRREEMSYSILAVALEEPTCGKGSYDVELRCI